MKVIAEDLFGQQYNYRIPTPKTQKQAPKQVKFKKVADFKLLVQMKPSIMIEKAQFMRVDAGAIKTERPQSSEENLVGESNGRMNAQNVKPLKARTSNLVLAIEHSIGFKRGYVPMENGHVATDGVGKYVVSDKNKPYLTFVTLTLPSTQLHRDVEITELFTEYFVKTMREQWGVEQYVWRKEPQKDSGNIHFHLLIDRFVEWTKIRKRWNDVVEQLGYVSRYRKLQLSRFRYNGKIGLGLEERERIAKMMVRWVKEVKRTKKTSCVVIREAMPYIQRAIKLDYYGIEKAIKDVAEMQLACFQFKVTRDKTEKNYKSFEGHIKTTLATRRVNPKAEPELKQYLFTLIKQGKKASDYKKIIFQAKRTKFAELDYAIQYRRFKYDVETDFADPNSTDIHAIQNLKSVTNYLGKYIAKESKIDKSWIGKNQEIVKEMGFVEQKYRDVETKEVKTRTVAKEIEYIITYEDCVSELDGSTYRKPISKEVYEPQYLDRKMNGKLWGCSNELRQSWVKFPEFEYKSFTVEKEEDAIVDDFKYTITNVDNEIINGMEAVKSFIGGDFIQAFTYSVEEKTRCRGMTFIPCWKNITEGEKTERLNFKASELLREHAPPLYEKYVSHYRELFAKLYPNATHYVQ